MGTQEAASSIGIDPGQLAAMVDAECATWTAERPNAVKFTSAPKRSQLNGVPTSRVRDFRLFRQSSSSGRRAAVLGHYGHWSRISICRLGGPVRPFASEDRRRAEGAGRWWSSATGLVRTRSRVNSRRCSGISACWSGSSALARTPKRSPCASPHRDRAERVLVFKKNLIMDRSTERDAVLDAGR